MDEFVAFREVLAPSGVILFYCDGEVVYVCASTNVFVMLGRYGSNLRRMQKGLRPYSAQAVVAFEFDDVKVAFCAPEALEMRKAELVRRYQPRHNIRVTPGVDLASIPAFTELLKLRGEVPHVARRYPVRGAG